MFKKAIQILSATISQLETTINNRKVELRVLEDRHKKETACIQHKIDDFVAELAELEAAIKELSPKENFCSECGSGSTASGHVVQHDSMCSKYLLQEDIGKMG